MRIAFLGLGHMGLPMARNLAAAGHDVTGFDVAPAACDAARDAGLGVTDAATDAVARAEIVFTMFQTGAQVTGAYRGTGDALGLLQAAPDGILFIDCSTIAVDDARAAHDLATAAGHRSLDAPVSGGVVGAENATLAFMVGGDEAVFAEAQPVLDAMARRVVHCGGAGLGQAAKVCNNMILAASQIAVAEAFVLGERLGLAHQALYDVVANASGQCWALTTNCPVPGPVPTSPANRDYTPGFAGALMDKDLGLAAHAVAATGTDAKLGMLARDIYRDWVEAGGADRDFSGVIEQVRSHSSPSSSREGVAGPAV